MWAVSLRKANFEWSLPVMISISGLLNEQESPEIIQTCSRNSYRDIIQTSLEQGLLYNV